MSLIFSEILIFISLVILTSYAVFLIFLILKWKAANQIIGTSNFQSAISIVIAARNESRNIKELLNSLYNLKYEIENFEVIIVDDHSSDDTYKICEVFFAENNLHNFSVVNLPNSVSGKKAAISFGISKSKYSLIACTDADCVVHEYWLEQISGAFETEKCRFLSMPVLLESNNSFLHKFQQLDFLFLNASGGASMVGGKPLMCNAANMAFFKEDFLDFETNNSNKIASGDDMFLMLFIKTKYQQAKACFFLKSEDSIVKTKAVESLNALLNQRIRWTKKAKYYNDNYVLSIGFLVGMLNLIFVTLFFTALQFNHLISVLGIFLLVRISFEYAFFLAIKSFYKISFSIGHFILSSIIYPFYVVFIGVLSIIKKFEWKQRKFDY